MGLVTGLRRSCGEAYELGSVNREQDVEGDVGEVVMTSGQVGCNPRLGLQFLPA